MAGKHSLDEETDLQNDQRQSKIKKTERVYINQEPTEDQIKTAKENGSKTIKFGISGIETEIPTKHTILKNAFCNILKKEDEIIVTRAKRLIITTQCEETTRKILKLEKINEVRVKVTTFEDSFTSQYIIHDVDQDISLEEIAESLKHQGIRVRKIIRFNNKKGDLSPTILVKELGVAERKKIKIDNIYHNVNTFEEKPKICHKCLRLGHFEKTCRDTQQKCYKCGGKHAPSECTEENPACFRCGIKGHTAIETTCTKIQTERKILNKVRNENITFTEARKAIEGNTYAKVVAGNTTPKTVGSTEKSQTNELTEIVKELKEVVKNLKELTELKEVVKDLKEVTEQILSHTKEERLKHHESGSKQTGDQSFTIREFEKEKAKKDLGQVIKSAAQPILELTSKIEKLAQTVDNLESKVGNLQVEKMDDTYDLSPGGSPDHLFNV